MATLALWFAFDLVYVSTGNETDHATPADVIIVLGCPSNERNIVSATFAAEVSQAYIASSVAVARYKQSVFRSK